MHSSSEAVVAISDDAKRAHRQFPTGVTVVTTRVDELPYGLTVNAFASFSIEPPLVMVCVAARAATHAKLYLTDHIAINVLSRGQSRLARHFAASGGEKFSNIEWSPGVTGSPVLADVSAFFEVRIEQRIAAHTHTLFVGPVVAAGASEHPPLVYFAAQFYDGGNLERATE